MATRYLVSTKDEMSKKAVKMTLEYFYEDEVVFDHEGNPTRMWVTLPDNKLLEILKHLTEFIVDYVVSVTQPG